MSLTIFRRTLPIINNGWYGGWYGFSNFILVATVVGIKYKSNLLFKN